MYLYTLLYVFVYHLVCICIPSCMYLYTLLYVFVYPLVCICPTVRKIVHLEVDLFSSANLFVVRFCYWLYVVKEYLLSI